MTFPLITESKYQGMNCHSSCGACCIAPEISSPLPNMPKGKPAGERCVNLDENLRCKAYELRPAVCRQFNADPFTCGGSHDEALKLIGELERATKSV